KGYPKLEWVKIRPRNEALDCEVYSYAAALRAGMATMNWDALKIVLSRDHTKLEKTRPKKRKHSAQRPSRW
ncbi:MAG: terminase gpA endonuclease subunit, partial [Planctomycetota bacterium]